MSKIHPRKYHPDRLIKPSGVHSFYLGQEGDPLVQIFDSFCMMNQVTFSHGVRSILEDFFREKKLIDQHGNLTDQYSVYRAQAEKERARQKEILENGFLLKPKRNRKKKA